jgi:hypothetical protein
VVTDARRGQREMTICEVLVMVIVRLNVTKKTNGYETLTWTGHCGVGLPPTHPVAAGHVVVTVKLVGFSPVIVERT